MTSSWKWSSLVIWCWWYDMETLSAQIPALQRESMASVTGEFHSLGTSNWLFLCCYVEQNLWLTIEMIWDVMMPMWRHITMYSLYVTFSNELVGCGLIYSFARRHKTINNDWWLVIMSVFLQYMIRRKLYHTLHRYRISIEKTPNIYDTR